MKIKLLAIALISTALIISPLLAQDNTDESSGNKAATATDYNSSRSNKSEDSGITQGGDSDDTDGDEDPKATDYNSSRSNKSYGAKLNGINAPETMAKISTM